MNSLIENELAGTSDLRDQLFGMLSDSDLAFALPGNNPSLGDLCADMGRIQQIYTLSFQTFVMDWAYRGSQPPAPQTLAGFDAWFKALDVALHAALSGLSEDDIQNRQIDRGHGFTPSPFVQFQIYREALLIFYAKASVYLKALEKPFTSQWKSWIG